MSPAPSKRAAPPAKKPPAAAPKPARPAPVSSTPPAPARATAPSPLASFLPASGLSPIPGGFDPMARLMAAKDLVLAPEPQLEAAAAHPGGIPEGLYNVVLSLPISLALVALSFFAQTLLSGPAGAVLGGGMMLATAGVVLLLGLVGSFIAPALYLAMGGLLGGRSTYARLYHIVSWTTLSCALLSIPSTLLGFIPCVGVLVSLAFALYEAYLLTLAMKKAFGFDTLKAVAVWLVPVIVISVVVAAVFMTFFMGALSRLL